MEGVYTLYNDTCVLDNYIGNEEALLTAYSAYRDGAVEGWASDLDETLQDRQMNFMMITMHFDGNMAMMNQCMRSWTPK